MNTAFESTPGCLRTMVHRALSQCSISSATSLAEKLYLLPDFDSYDHALFAKCLFLSGDYKRCIAILEQNNFLSASAMSSVHNLLSESTTFDTNIHSEQQVLLVLELILLAGTCLYMIDEFEDCLNLLDPLVYVGQNSEKCLKVVHLSRSLESSSKDEVRMMSNIYCLVGKCYDKVDNRVQAAAAFVMSLRIDVCCLEALDFVTLSGMLSNAQQYDLYFQLRPEIDQHPWLIPLYKCKLYHASPLEIVQLQRNVGDASNSDKAISVQEIINSTYGSNWLFSVAEYFYDAPNIEFAYQISRHAYTLDPHNIQGMIVYIACMMRLNLKTELFYLGHELANSHPKCALSWYAVGCYYWASCKLELARKYLQKATKLDKKFVMAWVALGHVLCSLEESEQAIASYRTATRLLPGDYRPILFMAKELVRTNYVSLAVHLLANAHELCTSPDPLLLNEMAVSFYKVGDLQKAADYFSASVSSLYSTDESLQCTVAQQAVTGKIGGCAVEVINNYATVLRKLGDYDAALFWLNGCLALNPSDANTHASIGFIHHVCCRIHAAITSYHRALALDGNLSFCADMLNRAMTDADAVDFADDNQQDPLQNNERRS